MEEIKSMRILQLNAGVKESSIPYRLMKAFEKKGIYSEILAMSSTVTDSRIILARKTLGFKVCRRLDWLLMRVEEKLFYKREYNLPFSFYRVGMNLTRERIVQDADILIVHWVCGTFLSPYGLRRLLKRHDKVILVCHDSWYFTGGCHVRLGGKKFEDGCGCCPQLHSEKKFDWSYRLLKMKEKAFKGKHNVTVVSPSHWMDQNVSHSELFREYAHCVIPNPIDISRFRPLNKFNIRAKWQMPDNSYIILFGAVNAKSTPYKGFKQFTQAIEWMEEKYEFMLPVKIYAFGALADESDDGIIYLGNMTEEQMIELYNCADVYVMPSLDDNLPGTVMESLACETPVVAFRTGGIPDMVVHKQNGYLAEYGDAQDLAKGIKWVIEHNGNNMLGKNGRQRICDCFEEDVVTRQYEHLIKKILNVE